jgi:hypothetical protein
MRRSCFLALPGRARKEARARLRRCPPQTVLQRAARLKVRDDGADVKQHGEHHRGIPTKVPSPIVQAPNPYQRKSSTHVRPTMAQSTASTNCLATQGEVASGTEGFLLSICSFRLLLLLGHLLAANVRSLGSG